MSTHSFGTIPASGFLYYFIVYLSAFYSANANSVWDARSLYNIVIPFISKMKDIMAIMCILLEIIFLFQISINYYAFPWHVSFHTRIRYTVNRVRKSLLFSTYCDFEIIILKSFFSLKNYVSTSYSRILQNEKIENKSKCSNSKY